MRTTNLASEESLKNDGKETANQRRQLLLIMHDHACVAKQDLRAISSEMARTESASPQRLADWSTYAARTFSRRAGHERHASCTSVSPIARLSIDASLRL